MWCRNEVKSICRLESFGPDNALYEYQIENASLTRPPEERNQEEQLAYQVRFEYLHLGAIVIF